jgi:ribosomal-protein-alanine N-acetyltransferase
MSAVVNHRVESFRPMLEADLAEILVIENAVYEFPWSDTIFRDCLRVGYCCWVLEDANGIINAYGVMSVATGECHILNLCVQPQSQGLGVGSRALEFLLDVAMKHRADTAFLEVRPSNKVARQLYSKAGFNEVGMRRNYYPGRNGREDAIIMARTLIYQ